MIEAAGGVVWRRTDEHDLEVVIVHRPRYDDWSLPKGKLESRETHLEAALREVEEETGLRCKAGLELPETHYLDRKGRAKRVRYWEMRPTGGRFRPNDEVDELQWIAIDDAWRWLSYDRELPVLDGCVQLRS